MLVNLGPILIALLAGALLKEGFPRTLLAGCAVAFGGAVVIGFATSSHGVTAGWGTTTYLVPPLAILLGWALLDESPPLLAFAGGALSLLGVALARRPSGLRSRL